MRLFEDGGFRARSNVMGYGSIEPANVDSIHPGVANASRTALLTSSLRCDLSWSTKLHNCSKTCVSNTTDVTTTVRPFFHVFARRFNHGFIYAILVCPRRNGHATCRTVQCTLPELVRHGPLLGHSFGGHSPFRDPWLFHARPYGSAWLGMGWTMAHSAGFCGFAWLFRGARDHARAALVTARVRAPCYRFAP